MSWFDDIKKMPWDEHRDQFYKPVQWSALPEGLKGAVFDGATKGAMNVLPGTFPREGADLSMIRTTGSPDRLPSNFWTPKLWLKGGLVGVYTAWDWERQDFATDENGQKQAWEIMTLTSGDKDAGPAAYRGFAGADTFKLKPEWIGVIVWSHMSVEEPEKATYGAEFYFGKDSTWFGKGRQVEAKRYPKRQKESGIEMLTNAEGAILWIYSRGSSRKGAPKLALKKRKELMAELNLGSNDSTQNPTLRGLVDRGFFRMPERAVSRRDGKVIREIPIINDKGHAHAPQMEPSVFEGAFRQEVLSEPEAPLMMGDFNEWIGDETEQGPVMDVGEMSEDKRPEWKKIMERDFV